jgi:hypothetical protein
MKNSLFFVFIVIYGTAFTQVLNIDREIDCFLNKKYLFAFLTKTELSINGFTALENNAFFNYDLGISIRVST